MVNTRQMAPEVLIYVQNLKSYFNSHEEDQKYFTGGNNVTLFFEQLSEMAQENFEKNGEPHLTVIQFEELRKNQTPEEEKKNEIIGLFISYGAFGRMSLN